MIIGRSVWPAAPRIGSYAQFYNFQLPKKSKAMLIVGESMELLEKKARHNNKTGREVGRGG